MNFLKIKKRINNLDNIHKITNALFLASLIKLKKYKKELLENSDFDNTITEILEKNYSIKKKDSYNDEKKNIKKLFVVITSNVGFCGNYNREIVDYIDKNVDKNSNILIIGENGYNLLKKMNYKLFEKFVSYDNDFLSLSKEIFFFATEENNFKEINLIFLKNNNLLSNIVHNYRVFPIDFVDDIDKNNLVIIEPNKDELLKKITLFYVVNNIYKTILIAKINEQILRINTMQNAEQNAKEMIDDLKNKYNKLRHLKITQEILENLSAKEV